MNNEKEFTPLSPNEQASFQLRYQGIDFSNARVGFYFDFRQNT